MLKTERVKPWIEKVVRRPELISSIMTVFRGYDLKRVHEFAKNGENSLYVADHEGYKKNHKEVCRLLRHHDAYRIVPDKLNQEYLDENIVSCIYSSTAEAFDSIADKHFPPVPRELAQSWLRAAPGERVLEIAVATGANLISYPTGVEIVGIDISEKSIEIAKKRALHLDNHIKIIYMNGERMSFDDGYFDKVLVLCGLCAAQNPYLMIHEANRVLRRGGRFVLYEPSLSYADDLDLILFLLQPVGREIGAIWFDDFPPKVIPYNTYWDVYAILRSARFSVVQEKFFDPPYNTLRMIECSKMNG